VLMIIEPSAGSHSAACMCRKHRSPLYMYVLYRWGIGTTSSSTACYSSNSIM